MDVHPLQKKMMGNLFRYFLDPNMDLGEGTEPLGLSSLGDDLIFSWIQDIPPVKHPVKPLEVVTQHHLSSPSLPSLPSLVPSHPYASALAAGGWTLGHRSPSHFGCVS